MDLQFIELLDPRRVWKRLWKEKGEEGWMWVPRWETIGEAWLPMERR